MTAMPARGAPAADEAVATAPVSRSGDGRGSPIPTVGMIATRIMELRKRRGLMITVSAASIGLPALFLLIRLLLHVFAPSTNPAAGGQNIFQVLVAGFLPTFGFITAAAVGCTAGSRDLTEGTFRHLVVTGRSRLALYLARIPAGLAIVVSLVAIGFTVVCAVCVFAAPIAVSDNGVNVPPGLSRAGFESWAANHAADVVCDFPHAEPVPGNLACATPPGWSVSSDAPSQPAPAALRALAIKVAKDDYPGYTSIWLSPPDSLMIDAGLWLELEAAVAFVIGLGLASLMGQRTVPLILLIMFQMIASPVLSTVAIPHLLDLQRSFVGLALAHLEPSALPLGFGVPGVAGGVARSGGPTGVSLLPESGAVAVLVIIAWLAGWTILGAWRMTTRDT
jgi:hypothetical protein